MTCRISMSEVSLIQKMKNILIPIFSFAICLSIIWKWTYGFSAFTIFSYTLNEAGAIPREFPDIQMVDQNGGVFNIKDKRKYVLINFVYLNCPDVCHKVNNQLEDIYHLLDSTVVPLQLEFVTVSFDIKNDDINKIKKYRSYFGSGISGWTFALPYHSNEKDFGLFLQEVGVWAYRIPESGLINHSIYLFLVSPENMIVGIFDPARDNNLSIIEHIRQCLKEKKEV